MRSQADLAKTLNQLNATITLRALLVPNKEAIATEQQRSGRFILATNVLDAQALSNDDMLREYKAQQSTERGFRFLKDPLFFTSSVFLNSSERVAALAMVMGLCLLVYSLGQRTLRQALKRALADYQKSVGQANCYSHYALGVSMFHVDSSSNNCWC